MAQIYNIQSAPGIALPLSVSARIFILLLRVPEQRAAKEDAFERVHNGGRRVRSSRVGDVWSTN